MIEVFVFFFRIIWKMKRIILLLGVIQVFEFASAKRYFTSLNYESLSKESEEFFGFSRIRCAAICLQKKCVYYDFEGNTFEFHGYTDESSTLSSFLGTPVYH